MATQGKYAVVDTTLSITDSTPIPGLNGRQGDNGRVVYFALKDGRLPHNLDGQDVALEVKDAAGKIKVVNGIYDMISATAGLFSMLIPAEVYQAAGDVEEAYLVVTDQKNLVISSVPITFTVFANGVIISANASHEYVNSVEEMVSDAKGKIEDVQKSIEVQKITSDSIKNAIQNNVEMIEANQVATLHGDNTFTGVVKSLQPIKGDLDGNAKSANSAKSASRLNIPFKYQTVVDLNEMPSVEQLFTSSVWYFASATLLKNAPQNSGGYGLVEVFPTTKFTVVQRLTETHSSNNLVWHRLIQNWNDPKNTIYGDWVSYQEVHKASIDAFGGTLTFTRMGNVVTVTGGSAEVNFKFHGYSLIYNADTIPAGYRPAQNYTGIVFETTASSTRSNGALQFGPAGYINSRSAYIEDDTKSWITISGTYITNDSMPK